MDEQLEQPIERGGAEAQSEEDVLSPAGEEAAKEAAERTDNPEAEINTESSAEENGTPDAELSAAQEEKSAEQKPVSEETTDPGMVVQPRNYYAEWQELAEAHPEVVGKELPEDIYQACMQSELPPLRVYESMMLQKQADKPAFSSESGGNVNKSGGGEEGAYVIGSELDAAKKIAQLPTSMQARYNDLPKTAQRALLK